MVLIAAAVTTKTGKTIMSRQFVEMTKARIEGLLAAFPKLMSTGKQHTFVETESVRYVYQPLEKLYMLLITTKASNILEDLETLRLFSRVIPEYCRSMDEAEIVDNAFNLIFAFDEIVALGYRESVNLAQIRTFVEMDSHEEKVYQAVRKTQEREAKNKMREKAKELQRQKLEAVKKGGKPSSLIGSSGFGSNSGYTPMPSIGDSAIPTEIKPSYTPSVKPAGFGAKSLKLGSKGRDVESFVDQLKNEGEIVQSAGNNFSHAPSKQATIISTNPDCVQLRQEETLTVTVGRDGALKNFELHGIILLRIEDEKLGRVRFQVINQDQRGVQLQTHPNIDKELFKSRGIIGLKNPSKPFPFNVDVGVLKWRYQTQDESALPLTINCWPSENAEGGCDVNIEYELEHQQLVLTGVVISIPLPAGTNPSIAACDGEYHHDPRKNLLQWSIPLIDGSNKSGGLEFAAPSSRPGDFFPMNVSFRTNTMYTDLKASDVVYVDDELPAKFVLDTTFQTAKFEIV